MVKGKVLISISGYSTVGKTYLSEHLISNHKDVYFIPQVTKRAARPDDNIKMIKTLSDCDYNYSNFFVEFNGYGILQDDYDKFIKSNKKLGVLILGINEVKILKSRSLDINYKNTFLRFADDIKEDKDLLFKRICNIRGKNLSRIKYNIKLANEYASINKENIIDASFISDRNLLDSFNFYLSSL